MINRSKSVNIYVFIGNLKLNVSKYFWVVINKWGYCFRIEKRDKYTNNYKVIEIYLSVKWKSRECIKIFKIEI